jgi:hypothetical protein
MGRYSGQAMRWARGGRETSLGGATGRVGAVCHTDKGETKRSGQDWQHHWVAAELPTTAACDTRVLRKKGDASRGTKGKGPGLRWWENFHMLWQGL